MYVILLFALRLPLKRDKIHMVSQMAHAKNLGELFMSVVLVAYETGCSTLNCFQELNVVLCVWIPYWSCVFHLGPEDRLVSHILYLSRAVFEVSTQDSKCLICL